MKTIHILILLLCLPLATFAQNAADILDKAAAAYRNSNGITASFSMRILNPQGSLDEKADGIIDMNGDRFALNTPGVKTWFDGKTQWVYMEQTNEVNLSAPDGDDLQLTNPAVLLKNYRKGYTPKYISESTGINSRSVHVLELLPKGKSDISKIILQIEKNSNLPIYIQLEAKNGTRTTIQITNIRTGINQPEATFSFRSSEYPGVEIIDLR
jgi:outer membrane lipoprotein-sorting protein